MPISKQTKTFFPDDPEKRHSQSFAGLEIHIMRKSNRHFLNVIIPSGVMVVMSWVSPKTMYIFIKRDCQHCTHFQTSFVIPPNVVPGRMGLLVTLVLVMINIFISMEIPNTDSYTSVSIWMIFCIIFICVAFWEYGFILMVNHYHYFFLNCTRKKKYGNSLMIAKVDSTFSLICMSLFLIFNIIFWSNIDY